MLKLSLIVVMSYLAGCTSWPPAGHGGMAEHRLGTLSPVMPGQPFGLEHGLRFELELVYRHLDVLVLEGANLCFPATVLQARQRQNRITHELHGGLDFDAANDLIIQRKLLAQLERQLDYVSQHDICHLTSEDDSEENNPKSPANMDKYIDELLNTENQFAFDSSDLNPKYAIRLVEAAKLLINNPDYRLTITGHADAVGENEHNLKLSLDRAKKVARFLQILGLSAERFQLDAVGSEFPLFNGNEPQTRLVNRRVNIKLSKTESSTQVTAE